MRQSTMLAVLWAVSTAVPSWAALSPGANAPNFSAPAAVGGAEFLFSLAEALKKGPVVLYFDPKSFTRGCTVEAHEFADNAENFAAAGASILGVSADGIETQREFSSKECRDKFPVAADPDLAVIGSYDAKRERPSQSGATIADRISYVVTPDGKIGFAHIGSDPVRHVQETLQFVRQWRDSHRH